MLKKLFLLPLMVLAVGVLSRAETRTFTVASLNVDGMPYQVKASAVTVTLNKDHKDEEGAHAIGKRIAAQSWDFVSLSEDFNYHSSIMEEVGQYYYAGTCRGKLTDVNTINSLSALAGNWHFDTDGLGFLYNKSLDVSGETFYSWNKKNGITDQGSDQLIDKGYRYYMVRLAPGMEVDVYIHHMDAETNEADNEARASQITQLVNHIKSTDNKRPIIIMGDTNCRYTRDDLRGLLFEALKADEKGRFECHDPWVESQWADEGGYDAPELQQGQPSIMQTTWGDKKGEVVDKIFYINNKDAEGVTLKAVDFRSATDFVFEDGQYAGQPLSDHYPVVVTFEIENPNDGIKPGTDYYMRNKATGKYLNAGALYGIQAVQDTYGTRVQLVAEDGENNYKIHTTFQNGAGRIFIDGLPELFLDDPNGDIFNIEEAGNGYYTIKAVSGNRIGMAFTANGNLVSPKDFTGNDDQLWEFLTKDDLIDELKYATVDNPIDATFLMPGAGVHPKDADNDNWKLTPRTNSKTSIGADKPTDANWNIDLYNTKPSFGTSNTQWNLEYTSYAGLPSGQYKLTYYGFSTTTTFERLNVEGGETTERLKLQHRTPSISGTESTRHSDAKALYSGNNKMDYFNEMDLVITKGQIKFDFYKNTSDMTWTNFDDFRLYYYGPTKEMNKAYDKIGEALADVAERLLTLEPDARASYNNNNVERVYAQHLTSTNGYDEVQKTYEAFAAATKKQQYSGADMTGAILNNSFEMGWMVDIDRHLPFWVTTWTGDNVAADNSNAIYHVENAHLDYVLNNWSNSDGDGWGCAETYQTIHGLPNGVYRLDALVTSARLSGDTRDHYVHIFGNNTFGEGVLCNNNSGHFEDATVEFTVRDGVATIGVIGADQTGAIRMGETVGSWYKADNFRLTYLYSIGFENVQKAIDEITSRAEEDGVTIDLSEYQQAVDAHSVLGDGAETVAEIFNLYASIVKTQTHAGAVMTGAIINNSFEYPTYGLPAFAGWNVTPYGDTKIVEANHEELKDTYGVDNLDGNYVYNTYDNDGTMGYPISQSIEDMPAGIYELTVSIASDENRYFNITACGQLSEDVQTIGKGHFEEGTLEFAYDTPEEPMTIGVTAQNAWYKADNFRLTLVEPYTEELSALTPLQGPWQMTESGRYYVVARHESGHHVMAPNDRGHRAILDDDNNIAKHLRGHELKATKLDDNTWTLSGNKIEVAGILAVADNDLHVTFDDSEAHTITNAAGTPLAFDPASKTFGYSDAHSVADVALYTDVDVNTGIGAVTVDADAPAAVYYNLQGVRVDNPTVGLYIKVVGRTATKVMVK